MAGEDRESKGGGEGGETGGRGGATDKGFGDGQEAGLQVRIGLEREPPACSGSAPSYKDYCMQS